MRLAGLRSQVFLSLLVLIFLPVTGRTYGSAELVRVDDKDPFHAVSSSLVVGNKGEQVLDVSASAEGCGDLWVFDHAELRITRERFADAQFVALPEAGCVSCTPLVVRWYHEPTGYIDFSVHVYRRRVAGEC